MSGARETILCGDIGGTNSRLELYELPAGEFKLSIGSKAPGTLLSSEKYQNEDFASFNEVVSTFLGGVVAAYGRPDPPAVACLAVAGPVKNNSVEFTNRKGWVVDGGAMEQRFHISKVVLINDFLGVGYGLLTLEEGSGSDLHKLRDTPGNKTGVIAYVGAGTGLGMGFLTYDSALGYVAHASEGGHADWSPRTQLEVHLLEFLKVQFGQKHRISNERIVSGIGLANIYEFLRQYRPDDGTHTFSGSPVVEEELEMCHLGPDPYIKIPNAFSTAAASDSGSGRSGDKRRSLTASGSVSHLEDFAQERDEALDEEIRVAGDMKAAVIAKHAAMDPPDPLCAKAMEILVGAYGAVCGSAALTWLPTGGLYVAGGLAPKNLGIYKRKLIL